MPSSVASLKSFQDTPITPILEYRAQRVPATLTNPSAIEWITGPYLGHSPDSVAYAEDSDAAETRNDLYRQALGQVVPNGPESLAVVVSTHRRRYFGAELASILVRMGIAAHLFIDLGFHRMESTIQALEPSMLVVLDEGFEEEAIPSSVSLCVTVRQTHRFKHHPQIDLYIVDELGLLGHSTDCQIYHLHHAQYHFEQSDSGRLIATSLYNLLQPKLRIETLDMVEFLDETRARLLLAPDGG